MHKSPPVVAEKLVWVLSRAATAQVANKTATQALLPVPRAKLRVVRVPLGSMLVAVKLLNAMNACQVNLQQRMAAQAVVIAQEDHTQILLALRTALIAHLGQQPQRDRLRVRNAQLAGTARWLEVKIVKLALLDSTPLSQ
eukprot:2863049-Amphidinium_carterae.2